MSWDKYCETLGACYGKEFVVGSAELDNIEYDFAEFNPAVIIGASNSASTIDLLQPKLRKLVRGRGDESDEDGDVNSGDNEVDILKDAVVNVSSNMPDESNNLKNASSNILEDALIDNKTGLLDDAISGSGETNILFDACIKDGGSNDNVIEEGCMYFNFNNESILDDNSNYELAKSIK